MEQIRVATATGNIALLPASAASERVRDAVGGACELVADPLASEPDAVLFAGGASGAQELRRRLAALPGPIVPLIVAGANGYDRTRLVSERTIMWDTMRDRVFGVAEVEERFGVRIDQLQDLLALTGDTSDNIPGVPSVGPKTAKDLLVEFGSLQGIYQRIDELKKKGLKDKLIEHKDKAFLSQQLVKLKDDCPIIIDHAHLAYGGRDIPALKTLYAELGMVDERLVRVVDLKFFCGFTFSEIAAMQRLSERTVQRRWEKARIYLHCFICTA